MAIFGEPRWWRAWAQPVTFLGVAVLAAIALTVAILIHQDHRHSLAEAERQGDNLARLFETSIARAIKSADHSLQMLRLRYQQNPGNTDLSAWVHDPHHKNDLTFQVSVIGPDGRIAASSLGPEAIGFNITDQEHFQVHVSDAVDSLFISRPIVLRTSGKRALVLTRRLTGPDGRFAGVVAASLDIQQIEAFHRSIDLGTEGMLALVGSDRMMRAVVVDGAIRPDLLGRPMRDTGLFRALERAPAGRFWSIDDGARRISSLDGVPRLLFYRAVDDTPLIAVVGIAEAAIYAHASLSTRIYLAAGALLAAFILTVMVLGAARERKLAAVSDEIRRQAQSDGLTFLANRALFRQHVAAAFEKMRDTGATFNLLALDLDHFKSVNDSLGHAAGDEMIRQVAQRLKDSVNDTDVVARLGGDEFAVLQFAQGDQRTSAIVLASRILERIGEPYDLDGHQSIVETSIGVALASAPGGVDTLLKNADLALYRAKSEGRNIFRLFEPQMAVDAQQRFELEADLRVSIPRDEFEVYYQPLVEAGTRQCCGVEALVRWNHPKRGLVMPDTFIPIAELTGLIVPLGERILRRACAEAMKWPDHIKVAVNLSPIQFRKGDLVDVIARALLESGLPPHRLELEITESVLLQRDDSNLSKLHELRSLGVAIALDDFGTGYSSLSYLRLFPFDKIKIDRSFISGMTTRSDCAAIVCALTGLARSLNVTTTAEGVETADQLSLLRAAGCHQAQGYLFGRPMRAADLDFGLPLGKGVAAA